jgi:hypothetical protein
MVRTFRLQIVTFSGFGQAEALFVCPSLIQVRCGRVTETEGRIRFPGKTTLQGQWVGKCDEPGHWVSGVSGFLAHGSRTETMAATPARHRCTLGVHLPKKGGVVQCNNETATRTESVWH